MGNTTSILGPETVTILKQLKAFKEYPSDREECHEKLQNKVQEVVKVLDSNYMKDLGIGFKRIKVDTNNIILAKQPHRLPTHKCTPSFSSPSSSTSSAAGSATHLTDSIVSTDSIVLSKRPCRLPTHKYKLSFSSPSSAVSVKVDSTFFNILLPNNTPSSLSLPSGTSSAPFLPLQVKYRCLLPTELFRLTVPQPLVLVVQEAVHKFKYLKNVLQDHLSLHLHPSPTKQYEFSVTLSAFEDRDTILLSHRNKETEKEIIKKYKDGDGVTLILNDYPTIRYHLRFKDLFEHRAQLYEQVTCSSQFPNYAATVDWNTDPSLYGPIYHTLLDFLSGDREQTLRLIVDINQTFMQRKTNDVHRLKQWVANARHRILQKSKNGLMTKSKRSWPTNL